MTSDEYWLRPIINEALQKLYENDAYLIHYDDTKDRAEHLSEWAVAFRFGVYLQEIAYQHTRLSLYQIDIEYNRNLHDVKRICRGTIRPDLIIHQRGSNENNLLAIEIKAWWSDSGEITRDKGKLSDLYDSPYCYRNAVFILVGKEQPEIEWIPNNDTIVGERA